MKRRVFTIIMALVMVLAFTGEVFGVSAPAKVTGTKATNVKQTTATLNWTPVKKNIKGYTIYLNGKAVKSVGKNIKSYSLTGLTANTNYTYTVKAYNTYKQYYNSKTKKWVNKKPKKKFWVGKKTRTAYKYGAGVNIKFKTLAKSTVNDAMTLKVSASGKLVTLSWASSKNISGKSFKIYQNGNLMTTVSKTSYSFDTSNYAAGTYKWQVVTETASEIWKSTTYSATLKAVSSSGGSSSNNGTSTNNSGAGNAGSSNTGNNGGGNSTTGGSNSQPTVEYVQVTDWRGTVRKVVKGSADEHNPKYNILIDGTFKSDSGATIIQKNGIAFWYAY